MPNSRHQHVLDAKCKVVQALKQPVEAPIDPKMQWAENADNDVEDDHDADDDEYQKKQQMRIKKTGNSRTPQKKKKGKRKNACNINGMQEVLPEPEIETPKKHQRVASVETPDKSEQTGVDYSKLRLAFLSIQKSMGKTQQQANIAWLESDARERSIAKMSDRELCRRRMGPYAPGGLKCRSKSS